jgi:hypothetical protein
MHKWLAGVGSYGGYLTLHGLSTRPDLWAGGMGSVAIADWTMMYENQADTLRCGKRHLFLSFPYVCPEPVLAK